MYLPTHRFIVDYCSPVMESRNHQHQYIRMILRKPAPVGAEFLEDDIFEVFVWDKSTNEIPKLTTGDKISALISLRGKKQVVDDSNITFKTQLSASKVALLTDYEFNNPKKSK